jgi:regulator of sirC expression with transglutaminase-like and TPR domain
MRPAELDTVSLDSFARLVGRTDGEFPLDVAALEVARVGYPGLDPGPTLARLDDLAGRTFERRLSDEGPCGFVATLTRSLFEVEGFRGNEPDYYDPRNSFLNDVVMRRLGIPITLSVVLLEVARRLEWPVRGVSFPGHFLVRAEVEDRTLILDPYSGGRILDEVACQEHLDRVFGAPVALDRRFLEPVGSREIATRMLNNLKGIFLTRRDLPRALAVVERLLLLRPDEMGERRDRGKLRYSLGDFHGAAADLERYLESASRPKDQPEVTRILRAIRKRQASVN